MKNNQIIFSLLCGTLIASPNMHSKTGEFYNLTSHYLANLRTVKVEKTITVGGDAQFNGNMIVAGTVNGTTIGGGGDGQYLPLAGGTMTGDIDMGTKDITNAGTITATSLTGTLITGAQPNITGITGSQLATPYLPLAGGTMTGTLTVTNSATFYNATIKGNLIVENPYQTYLNGGLNVNGGETTINGALTVTGLLSVPSSTSTLTTSSTTATIVSGFNIFTVNSSPTTITIILPSSPALGTVCYIQVTTTAMTNSISFNRTVANFTNGATHLAMGLHAIINTDGTNNGWNFVF